MDFAVVTNLINKVKTKISILTSDVGTLQTDVNDLKTKLDLSDMTEITSDQLKYVLAEDSDGNLVKISVDELKNALS